MEIDPNRIPAERQPEVISDLYAVATGRTRHVYAGGCPDTTDTRSRDPECPACTVVAAADNLAR